MIGYIFEHEGKQYAPEGRVDIADVRAHNDAVQAAELAYWQTKPERFAPAYVSEGALSGPQVTTWGGVTLGKIIERRRYRNRLTGSRMECVRVAGNNGATYYGKYGCDWSQAVRLRKVKGEN